MKKKQTKILKASQNLQKKYLQKFEFVDSDGESEKEDKINFKKRSRQFIKCIFFKYKIIFKKNII